MNQLQKPKTKIMIINNIPNSVKKLKEILMRHT